MGKAKAASSLTRKQLASKSTTRGIRISDDAIRMSQGIAEGDSLYSEEDNPYDEGYYYRGSNGNKAYASTKLASVSDHQTKEMSLYVGDTDDGRDDEEMWLSPMAVIKDNPDHDKILKTDSNGGVTDDALSGCNPTYDNGDNPYSRNNCAKCTFALEMRQRGYDVSAGRSVDGASFDSQSHWWKGAEEPDIFDDDNGEEAAMKKIMSYGKNTSGEVRVAFGTSEEDTWGHSMHYTVDNDGKFEIQDGQTGKRYSSFDDFYDSHPLGIRNCVNVTRLDNCEPNFEAAANDSCIRENPNSKSVRDSGLSYPQVNRYVSYQELFDDNDARAAGRKSQADMWTGPDDYVTSVNSMAQLGNQGFYKSIINNYDLDTPVSDLYDPYYDEY